MLVPNLPSARGTHLFGEFLYGGAIVFAARQTPVLFAPIRGHRLRPYAVSRVSSWEKKGLFDTRSKGSELPGSLRAKYVIAAAHPFSAEVLSGRSEALVTYSPASGASSSAFNLRCNRDVKVRQGSPLSLACPECTRSLPFAGLRFTDSLSLRSSSSGR
jgi:hypothetical protein